MKRLLSTVLTIAMTFTLLVEGATAAPSIKSGSNCTKLNLMVISSGIKFQCMNSSKKLVWKSRGAVAVKPTKAPTPNALPVPSTSSSPTSTQPNPRISPSPTTKFEPWNTNSNEQTIVGAEQVEFYTWIKTDHGQGVQVKIYLDPALELMNTDWIVNSASLAAKAFGTDDPQDATEIVGKSYSWVQQEAYKLGQSTSASQPVCGPVPIPQNLYCSDGHGHGIFLLQRESDPATFSVGALQTPAHEFFHSVQRVLMNGRGFLDSGVPVWFVEGSAYFIGINFSQVEGLYSYESGRDSELKYPTYISGPHVTLEQYTYDRFNPNLSTYLNPYGIGSVAVEYIVASVGMDSMLDIFRNVGKGQDFPIAFENATRIPLATFYRNFEILRDSIGIPHGV